MSRGAPSLVLALCVTLSLLYALLHPPSEAFFAGGALGGTQVIGETFPKRLIDPLGRDHLLQQPPRRIASAILAGDEMLAELVACDRLVAVSDLVDNAGISNVAGHYPAEIPRIQADIEAMLAVQPDLALVSTHSDALGVRMLMASGVAVTRFAAFESFAEIADNLRLLGGILGVAQRAEAAVAQMEQRLRNVERRVAGRPRPRVLYYDMSGSTGGPGTLTDEMIERAGGNNLIRETGIIGYTRITRELAIALQPDVVILSDWSSRGDASTTEQLLDDPAWQAVPAVQNERVHALRGAWVTSGSQFRVAGVEALARLLHPEAFAAPPFSLPAAPPTSTRLSAQERFRNSSSTTCVGWNRRSGSTASPRVDLSLRSSIHPTMVQAMPAPSHETAAKGRSALHAHPGR